MVQRSLSTKILAVYTMALGISFTGLGVGLLWARHIETQAQLTQLEVIEDLEDIHHLQSSVSRLLVHHLVISQWLRSPTDSSRPEVLATLSNLHQDSAHFKKNWQHLLDSNEFGAEEDNEALRGLEPTEKEVIIARFLIQNYQSDVKQYFDAIASFFSALDQVRPNPDSSFLIEHLSILEDTRLLHRIDTFNHQISELTLATEEGQHSAQQLNSEADQAQIIIVSASAVLSGLLGLAILSLLVRSLLRPLKEMTQLTQQSIEDQDFNIEIPVHNSDESGVLADTFNAYAGFVTQLLEEKTTSNAVLNSTLAELKRSQVQVIQSEKMSSLGQMMAGISHEINNPLGFISSNLVYVQSYVDDVLGIINLYKTHYSDPIEEIQERSDEIDLAFVQEDLSQVLQSMKIGSNRIREIINSLRNFSRIDDTQIVASNIHEGLENTLLILKHRLQPKANSPNIELVKDYGNLPEVECYPGLLNQVFMNVLANAIDALEEVYCKQAQPRHPILQRDYRILITSAVIKEGQWVEIAIADNGPGIPEAVQQKIFDPFFTTKPTGKGTGMGMSISQLIVTERHGGRFECVSEMGKGTTLIIQLPVHHSDRLISMDPPDHAPTEVNDCAISA